MARLAATKPATGMTGVQLSSKAKDNELKYLLVVIDSFGTKPDMQLVANMLNINKDAARKRLERLRARVAKQIDADEREMGVVPSGPVVNHGNGGLPTPTLSQTSTFNGAASSSPSQSPVATSTPKPKATPKSRIHSADKPQRKATNSSPKAKSESSSDEAVAAMTEQSRASAKKRKAAVEGEDAAFYGPAAKKIKKDAGVKKAINVPEGDSESDLDIPNDQSKAWEQFLAKQDRSSNKSHNNKRTYNGVSRKNEMDVKGEDSDDDDDYHYFAHAVDDKAGKDHEADSAARALLDLASDDQ